MTETRKIAHNTVIQTIGKIITVAVGLFAFGLIARTLGQTGYGYFATVYAFLTVFGILVDLGLQMTTTKLISDPAKNEGEIISNAVTLRLATSIIFLGLAPLVVLFFPYLTIIKIGVAIAALGFLFTSLTSTLTSLFQKHLAMYKVVIADVVAKIFYLAFLLLALYWQTGLLGIITATVLDTFFAFVILYYLAASYTKIKLTFQPAVWRKILVTTWPIALTIALNLIYFKGDLVIMSLMRSQAEVGLYGAPYKILEVLINVIYLFLGLILPLMAAAVAINNLERLKSILQHVFEFLIIISLPLIVGGYFLGEQIMTFMAGKEFLVSGDLLKILLIATASIFIAALFGYAVVALNQQKKMIKFYALNAVVSVVAYLIFIPLYSYWAAAWITVLSELFILLTAYGVVYKTIKFVPRLKIVWQSLAACVVMAIPLIIFSQFNFIILIVIGALVYFVILYIIGGINKQTLLEIVKIRNN